MVGRSSSCDYPPEVTRLPAVGGFASVSLEAVLALRPSLVVGAHSARADALAQQLAAHGISSFFPSAESLVEIFAMFRGLGQRLSRVSEAEALCTRLQGELELVRRQVVGVPRVRALVLVGAHPFVAAAPGSFLDELVALAGGDNVLTPAMKSGYVTLGVEQLLALAPATILDLSGASATSVNPSPRQAPLSELGLDRYAPLRGTRRVCLDDERVERPGPRVAESARLLASALHLGRMGATP